MDGSPGAGAGAEQAGRGEATDRGADLVALPADGGERVDHAVDAVDLAYEVRRVIVAGGRGRAHPRHGAAARRPDLLLLAAFASPSPPGSPARTK